MFDSLELPQPPSFNEKDMGDKAKSMLWRKPLTNEDLLYLEEHYRLRIESLQAVDEMVESIISILEKTGQLDNTYVFFTSDNGIQMGEHRLVEKKNWPYGESMRVPLLVMGPGIRRGLEVDEITGNIDIAPTIAALAGAPTADFVDGRSLLPLLFQEEKETWRDAYLIQSAITVTEITEDASWYGLRTDQYLYLEFDDGIVHIYDIRKDPYEMDNFSATVDPKLLDKFHIWLEHLRNCTADECRNYELSPEKWE
jgi:arylsulfatase A-like enzyme